MPLKPSDQAQPCTSPCLLSQYTHKFQQELQNFKVDVKDLDLLTPDARRDLEALQGSGLEKIHYGDFLVQVSEAHICPAGCDTQWKGHSGYVSTVSPLLGLMLRK